MSISAEQKFKDNLNEILEFIKQSAQSAADFAQEQIPIFIKEILTYYTYFHLLSIIILVGLALGFIYLGNRIRASQKDEDSPYGLLDDDNEFHMGSWSIPSYLLSLCFLGASLGHVIDLIKVTVAPRLYLLEYAAQIINGGGGCG